jgi:hypothetical protein
MTVLTGLSQVISIILLRKGELTFGPDAKTVKLGVEGG